MQRLRLRRWARLGGVSAVLLAALTVAVVQAASNTDYAYDEHNGCEFHGAGHYDTAEPVTDATTDSLFGCATYHQASVWTWNGSSYVGLSSAWTSGEAYRENTNYSTTLMYGYHQIRAPAGSYSTTIETQP
ncbi:MAG: hypothetical protein ACSLFM_11305 [Tepidiformaceae bacterium]